MRGGDSYRCCCYALRSHTFLSRGRYAAVISAVKKQKQPPPAADACPVLYGANAELQVGALLHAPRAGGTVVVFGADVLLLQDKLLDAIMQRAAFDDDDAAAAASDAVRAHLRKHSNLSAARVTAQRHCRTVSCCDVLCSGGQSCRVYPGCVGAEGGCCSCAAATQQHRHFFFCYFVSVKDSGRRQENPVTSNESSYLSIMGLFMRTI